MTARLDHRGCPISGATPAALQSYERALAAWQSWRAGAEASLADALAETPDFVMAHVLAAYLRLSSRDADSVRSARPIVQRLRALRSNDRERLHLAAIEATLADDYERTKARLGELLRLEPRDAVALQVAHAFDYVTGDAAALGERAARVLPAWTPDLPGYHAVLAMQAFGLEECGEYEAAEERARAALALNPRDARAHHVMAHVFEMTERAPEGERWLSEHATDWSDGTIVATHGWWHLALFQLAQGRLGAAIATYDTRVREPRSAAIADLIDASALLWRVRLAGGATDARWAELAEAWAPHIEDRFCSFNDLHAMLAFVGAGDLENARRLEQVLVTARGQRTRHGHTTREIGLPACRGIVAFGRGDNACAIKLLGRLPERAHRFGGSHAQRDVLHLTLMAAVERFRRPTRRPRGEALVAAVRRAAQRWQRATAPRRSAAALTP